MGKKVAITGVTSYFASTLLPKLQADNDVEEIIGIDTRPWTGGYNKVTFYREDIRSDKMVSLLQGVDTVYHLAYIVGEIQDKQQTLDININGSKNVFQACAKNKVKKVVYTSSMTTYGSHKNNILGFKEDADETADLSLLTHENELAFLRKAMELTEVIELMATVHEPHHITFYAYELAAAFHKTYETCRVLHSDVPEPLRLARLRFYRAAKTLFARVLDLMGMSAPEVM